MEHETIEIKYQTDGGHGCMTLNAENFLLKKVIALCYWDEQEKVISQIEDHCTRGIAETEEYKKLMPKFYQETKEHIPELEGKVIQYERMVERIQEDKKKRKRSKEERPCSSPEESKGRTENCKITLAEYRSKVQRVCQEV